jgi:2,4-dienoyl-CoA reductase (NADPH2)
MVSMARPFLADPELVQKSRQNREDEINTCIACNQACLDHVFVGKVASCLVNPRACHETSLTLPVLSQGEKLSIGVVGAGPAGCAFAITAAQIGHSVTLYDKDSRIGGQFNMAKRIPGKEEFHETLCYFESMLKKYKVQQALGKTVNAEDMVSTRHDKWILATGVDPRDPKIPGQDHPNVLSYIDLLKHQKPVGERVAVIGAGGIGFDVSEYLLYWKRDKTPDEVSSEEFWKEWGIDKTLSTRGGLAAPCPPSPSRRVYLLQRKHGKVGAGLGKTTGWIHRASLNNSGAVEMLNGVKYVKIDDNGHLHITQKGKSRVIEVDNIVICAGQVEKRDLENGADGDLTGKVYTIGGAYRAGELDAKRAIDMGTRLALKIHDLHVVPGKHVFKAEEGVEEKLYILLKKYLI